MLSKGPYMNEGPCTPSEFELIEKKFQLSVFALANPTLVGKEKAWVCFLISLKSWDKLQISQGCQYFRYLNFEITFFSSQDATQGCQQR